MITCGDFAKAKPGSTNPALVISGERNGAWGVYHSDDYFDSANPTRKMISLPDFPLLEPREVRGCKQDCGRGWTYGRVKQ